MASSLAAVHRIVGDHEKAFAIISENSNVTLMGSTEADVLVTSAEFEAREFYITGSDMNLSSTLVEITTLKANDAAKDAKIATLEADNAALKAAKTPQQTRRSPLKMQRSPSSRQSCSWCSRLLGR